MGTYTNRRLWLINSNNVFEHSNLPRHKPIPTHLLYICILYTNARRYSFIYNPIYMKIFADTFSNLLNLYPSMLRVRAALLLLYSILFYSIPYARRNCAMFHSPHFLYMYIYIRMCVTPRGGVQRDSLKWSQIFASTINVYIHTEEWLERCIRVWWNLCVYILFSLTFQPPFKGAHFASLTRIATKMWWYHWLYVVGYKQHNRFQYSGAHIGFKAFIFIM